MTTAECGRLAEFSEAVRESTLKRLLLVPDGSENLRACDKSMSFADIAKHLIDADRWLSTKLENPEIEPLAGIDRPVEIEERSQYLQLLEELKETGRLRRDLIKNLTDERLDESIPDARFGGEVSLWWVIVRGSLDHEAHHRGQISTLLQIAIRRANNST